MRLFLRDMFLPSCDLGPVECWALLRFCWRLWAGVKGMADVLQDEGSRDARASWNIIEGSAGNGLGTGENLSAEDPDEKRIEEICPQMVRIDADGRRN